MKKKEYIRPEISVFQRGAKAIMATSQIEMASYDDYNDEDIDDYWEDPDSKFIWAD